MSRKNACTMAEHLSVVIVGAGVTGLTSALLLRESGIAVTIIARDIPGDETLDWSSPWAGAILAAHPEGDSTLQEKSLEYYHRLLEQYGEREEHGIARVKITEYYDDMDSSSDIWYKNNKSPLFQDFELLPKTSLLGKATLGFSYTGFVVDPTKFLPWIKSKLETLNVKFIRKTIDNLEEAKKITNANVVVNASGLGARELVYDEDVQPIRGQTMLVSLPDSQLDLLKNAMMYQGSQYTYIIPRPASKSVVLGGIKQPGSTSVAVDLKFRKDIVQRVNTLSGGAFEWLDQAVEDSKSPLIKDIVGFRPGRSTGLRVEKAGDTVVHAYGAAGLGYLYSFGVADRVRGLILGSVQS